MAEETSGAWNKEPEIFNAPASTNLIEDIIKPVRKKVAVTKPSLAKVPLKDLAQLQHKVTVTNKNTGEVIKEFNTREEALKAGYVSGKSPSSRTSINKVYKVGDDYTLDKPNASVELDKKTGKITLKNLDDSISGDRLNEVIDRLKLKDLSAIYKANPNAAIPVSDNSDETKTVEEILADYNTQTKDETTGKFYNTLDAIGQQYKNADTTKNSIKASHKMQLEDGTIVDLELSDQDILFYDTNMQALQKAKTTLVDKLTDETRLFFPEEMAEKYGVNKLASYKKEEGVGLRDFMENYYNRQDSYWESRQEVDPTTGSENLGIFTALENYIKGKSQEGNIFIHDDRYTANLATAISAYNFLAETDPVCSWWQGASDLAMSAVNGIESVLEGIGEAGATSLVLAGDTVMNMAKWVVNKAFSDNVKFSDDTLLSTAIAEAVGYGPGTSFYEISDSIQNRTLAVQQEINKYNSAAAPVFVATEFLGELATIVATGNAFADTAVSLTGKTANWITNASNRAATLGTNIAMANGLSGVWQLTGTPVKAASVSLNLISKALSYPLTTATVSILGESVGEALMQNPNLVAQLLTSDDLTGEARQFMMDTVMGNALGGGIAIGASRGLTKIGETTIGKAVNIKFNRIIWAVSNWAGDTLDAVRVFFSKEDDIISIINKGAPEKIDIRTARRLIRAAKQFVLDNSNSPKILGMSLDEIAEEITKYDKVLARQFSVENAFNHMASRGLATANMWLSQPDAPLNGAYKIFMKRADELIELSRKVGMKAIKRAGYSLLPDDVRVYVTSTERLAIARAYEAAIEGGYDVGVKLQAIKREVTYLNEVLKEVTPKLPANIISKANDFIESHRNLNKAWTDFRVNEGLLSKEEIKFLRDSERWGTNGKLYVEQLRMVKSPKRVLKRTDNLQDINTLEKLGRYNFGSELPFADPILTFQNSLRRSAQKYDRDVVFRMFKDTDMVTTKVDSSTIKLVEAVNEGKDSLSVGIREAFDSTKENIITSKVVDSALKLGKKDIEADFATKSITEGELFVETDDIVEGWYNQIVKGNSNTSNMLETLAKEYAPNATDAAKKYLVYDAINNDMDYFVDKLTPTLVESLKGRQINGRSITIGEIDEAASKITANIKQNVKDNLDFNRVELSRAGDKAQTLINHDEWYGEIRDLAKEVGDNSPTTSNIVVARNADGDIEYYECSPLLASFMKTQGAVQPAQPGLFAKINYAWMRLFRFGTTGPNPVSWVNQFFRDFGNAWLVGGATKTISEATDIITDVFGSNLAYYLGQFSDEFTVAMKEIAEKEGRSVARVLAETEVSYGKEIVGKQSEMEALRAYRQLRDGRYINGNLDQTFLQRSLETTDKFMQKADLVNEARESWLRTRTYANSYADALKNNLSVNEARVWAEHIATNATTNFTRGTTFLTQFQNTIPYLRSSINGTKSFWRLWQVDPVGVTGRIIGGLVIPMWGLTAITLSDPKNREVYKRIKEYQKDSSLAFVVDGQAFFIPIPQEVATFINPIRQIMEGTFDVSTNSFNELALSDILALSPLDLSGFANLDSYQVYADGDFGDRIMSGTSKLAAQILPKYLNSLVAIATGRDLYTGNRIDNTYTTVDPDTGESIVMDYNSGEFAKWLHSVFPGLSAPMAENILKSTIGQVGIGFGNWMTDMVQSVTGEQSWGETITNIASGLVGAVTSPLTGYVPANEANAAWNQMLRQLYAEKEALMQSDEYKAYMKNASTASSDAQIKALSTQRKDIVEPFFDKVKNAVNTYLSTFGRGLTQQQFASTISLMVMFQNTDAVNVVVKEANSEAYKAARAGAVATMQRLGFPNTGTQDALFGRIRTNSTGETYIEYNNPLAVLNYQQSEAISGSIHRINMTNILNEAGLTTYAKSQGYKQQTTKASKKQYKKDWNSKVIKTLEPYVKQYGLETILSDWDTAEALDDYIYTDKYYNAKEYVTKVFEGE